MINKNFQALYPGEISQLKFFEFYRKICREMGVFYMGYILEDSKSNKRVGFTTNLSWGKEYIENYVEVCHLWNKVQNFFEHSKCDTFILPWETIRPKTGLQKDILLRRQELFIGGDGISFCHKRNSFREYYYFAPEIKQKNFLSYVSKNIDLLKNGINLFRNESIKTINDSIITERAKHD